MLHPMTRMFWIGAVGGVGFCNLLWMIAALHPVNFGVLALTMAALTFLYIDHYRYYNARGI